MAPEKYHRSIPYESKGAKLRPNNPSASGRRRIHRHPSAQSRQQGKRFRGPARAGAVASPRDENQHPRVPPPTVPIAKNNPSEARCKTAHEPRATRPSAQTSDRCRRETEDLKVPETIQGHDAGRRHTAGTRDTGRARWKGANFHQASEQACPPKQRGRRPISRVSRLQDVGPPSRLRLVGLQGPTPRGGGFLPFSYIARNARPLSHDLSSPAIAAQRVVLGLAEVPYQLEVPEMRSRPPPTSSGDVGSPKMGLVRDRNHVLRGAPSVVALLVVGKRRPEAEHLLLRDVDGDLLGHRRLR